MLGLTKKTEYGLTALVHLARNDPERLSSARAIARHNGMPVSLVMNVLKELTAGGLVESARGVQGGYRLAREPCDIHVAELIALLEGPIRRSACQRPVDPVLDDVVCDCIGRCPFSDPVHCLHRRIADALRPLCLTDLIPPVLSANVVISDNPDGELNHGDIEGDLSGP